LREGLNLSKEKVIYYLICLYIIVVALCPARVKPFGITLEDSILGIILILYVIIILINIRERENFKEYLFDFFHNPIGILMAIISVIMIVSVIYSLEKKLSITESVRFITYVGMYFIVKYNIQENSFIKNIRNVFVSAAVLLSLFGIIQYFTGVGLDAKFMEQYSFGAKARIATIFVNPNSYGGFLILAIFPIIMMGLECKQKREKIIYLSSSIVLLINLVLTFSRNSWAAFALGLFILVVLYNWKLIFGFIVVAITSTFVPVISNRLKDFTDMQQNISRFHHWQTALFMIKDHPILGVGNGNYVSYYGSYIEKYPYLDYAYQSRFPTHNSYLKVASELGILGILSFVLLVIVSVSTINKALNYMNDSTTRSFYTGFLVSSSVFLFMNFFDNLFFVPKVTVWFWFLLAIADGFIFRDKKLGYN
jgi:putative inorganic carbon (hco3(-)) transporter